MKVLANYLVSVAPLCLLLVSAASRVDGSPSLPLVQEAPSLRGGHSSVADLGLKAETADREEFRRRSLGDAKTDTKADTKTGSSAKGADGTGGAPGSSTATASPVASSAAAPETAASKTDKGSIASRTATYSAKKESSPTIESLQAMGIKVVKPETAAPSPAPPKTAATATTTNTTTTTTGSNAGNAGGTATVNPTPSSSTTAPSVLSSKPLASANSNSRASTSTDDVASLVVKDYDDDSLNYTVGNETAHSNNKPLAIPKEKAQPEEWPEVVAGVFVLGALVMMCATFVTNYRKRKNYESIPTTLTV
eukprot:CAMPEP_0172357322 /NCGR_PEP_ID=MMETSP1060-20121228/1716_1 /TAXON_ID=37318 /ORGANISM="Pseudo-nitzschia pungens, Strain cf. cingulata" /LENGTH=307 /DNA_ID=CAMNT_0013077961 /DNA_START=46 /DNA_END=969 /DNA_ORIENTATION=-